MPRKTLIGQRQDVSAELLKTFAGLGLSDKTLKRIELRRQAQHMKNSTLSPQSRALASEWQQHVNEKQNREDWQP